MARHLANVAVQSLKTMMPEPGCTMDEVVAYGREVMKHRAGNCFEQCAAGCVYLAGSHERPQFRLVRLSPPGDHIFLVFNQDPDGAGFFPDDFANWNAGAPISGMISGIVGARLIRINTQVR